jgi:hypothetical protein
MTGVVRLSCEPHAARMARALSRHRGVGRASGRDAAAARYGVAYATA